MQTFLSIDPLTSSYPMLTPYQFASNSPIANVDLDGLEKFYAADGSYIGQYETNTEIRIVPKEKVTELESFLTNSYVVSPDYFHNIGTPIYSDSPQPKRSQKTDNLWKNLKGSFSYASQMMKWLVGETAAGVDKEQFDGAGNKALEGNYDAAALSLVTSVIEKKFKIKMKGSEFGDKVANSAKEFAKKGVPKGWSKSKIGDAIRDFKTSIKTRVKEWKHFNKNGGDEIIQSGHAKRISIEEDYLKTLEKAFESRK